MKIDISKNDIVWSYLSTIMSLASNVLTLPLVVYFLSEEMLGLWYVFVSIGSISILFDFGFTVTFARNITYCWCGVKELHKNGMTISEVEDRDPDYLLMANILLTCKRIYFILSITFFLLLITLGTWYIMYISTSINGSIQVYAWLIYSFGIYLNLYYNYYGSFLRGVGAIDVANKNMIYSRALQIFFMLLLLCLGWGIMGLTIASLIYGISFRYLSKSKFYKYKNIGVNLGKIKERIDFRKSIELFKIIWYNAWRDGVIQLSSYLSGQVNVIICSLYLTLKETGMFSLSFQMIMSLATISSVLYQVYQPALQSACASNDLQKTRKTMSLIVPIFTYTYFVGLLALWFIAVPLIECIKPGTSIDVSILLGLGISQYIFNLRNCYTSYFSCTNRIIYMKSFITSSLLSLILSLILIGPLNLGVWALVLSPILSQLVFNIWYWPYCAHKEMDLGVFEMFSYSKQFFIEKLCRK